MRLLRCLLQAEVDANAYIARFRNEGGKKRKGGPPEPGPGRTRARIMGATLQYSGPGSEGSSAVCKGMRSC